MVAFIHNKFPPVFFFFFFFDKASFDTISFIVTFFKLELACVEKVSQDMSQVGHIAIEAKSFQ